MIKEVNAYIEKYTGYDRIELLAHHEKDELVCFLVGKLTAYERERDELSLHLQDELKSFPEPITNEEEVNAELTKSLYKGLGYIN